MTSINNQSTVGMFDALRNGFWFYFTHNGHEFAAHANGMTGGESVYVDDSKVSDKLSWRFTSGHDFELDGHAYRVEFAVTSIWKGQIACRFFVDGKLQETTESAMIIGNKKLGWKTFFALFAIGVVFGALGAYIGTALN